MHKYLHTTVLALVLILAGCATAKVPPPAGIKEPRSAMLYGYIELDDHTPVAEIEIQQYGKFYLKPFVSPPRVLVYNDGTFVAENIEPGKYVIARVNSFKNRYDLTATTRQYYQRILHVKAGELTYAGSYHLRRVNVSEGRSQVELIELQRPGERDLLKELYRITEYTGWQHKVTDRMKQLRQ